MNPTSTYVAIKIGKYCYILRSICTPFTTFRAHLDQCQIWVEIRSFCWTIKNQLNPKKSDGDQKLAETIKSSWLEFMYLQIEPKPNIFNANCKKSTKCSHEKHPKGAQIHPYLILNKTDLQYVSIWLYRS